MSGIALTPEVALVGSGESGIGISHPLDCNVYLIDGGDELALVDSGTGLDSDGILANVSALGHDPRRIRHLFLTHAHGDHAGGAAGLRAQLGARVYLSDAERAALEAGDEVALGLDVARRNGYYPADYRLPPCAVAHPLGEGERVRCGRLELEVLATPGHSAGSTCLVLEGAEGRALFAGDTVFAGGKISLLVIPGADLLALADSVARLAAVRPAALLPGHGPFPLRDAHEHVERAQRTFESMLPPPQILQ
jgi:hydroxyacylglutathione hydrolase